MGNKFRYKFNRSDVLVEIAERLEIELEKSQKSIQQLAQDLDKSESYVQGVLAGVAKITVEELADLFTALDKVLAIIPASRGERKYVKIVRPLDRMVQYHTVHVEGTKPAGCYNLRICYEDVADNTVINHVHFNNQTNHDDLESFLVKSRFFGIHAVNEVNLPLQINSNTLSMKVGR